MRNAVSEIIRDIDGSVLAVSETVILTEGIRVVYYSEPGSVKPHEISLYFGDDAIEMNYSESLEDMFGRINEISMVDLLKACYENLWQPKANVA
ncbi:hypothetical protein MPH47_12085 [Psychrobacillus psychrodurans]|uniref:hypothetical protein n=1 Tax=Psychrobacillus psychrodurans TaxID=126157 RepID=UPI001F4E8CD8|nr:hypothetical protein [Psychrobacillus psychrodurans]MCK1997954.1 hypothetical protein [Psychrobacillus psychrodurans]